MTAETYEKWSAPFRNRKGLRRALLLYNTICTFVFAAVYLVATVWLAVQKDGRAVPCIAVPAAGFLLVSLLRVALNRPRPYEALAIVPLTDKKTTGKSMPSRHVFSAFSLSVVFFYLCPWAGAVAALSALALSYARVVLGVHFPSDVLVGAAIGLGLTALGLYLPVWGWIV